MRDASPFPTRPAGPERRFSARYLLLVYEKTLPHFDPLEIRRLAAQEKASCTIVREQSANGLCNYLAFIDFSGKRFQTRNERLFDIQGYHPRWCPISSSPATYYDQCLRRGHVVYREAPRPRERCSKKQTAESPGWQELAVSKNREDFFETCKEQSPTELAPQLDNIHAYLEKSCATPFTATSSDVSQLTMSWTEGFKVGFDTGLKVWSKNFSRRLDAG